MEDKVLRLEKDIAGLKGENGWLNSELEIRDRKIEELGAMEKPVEEEGQDSEDMIALWFSLAEAEKSL